jgi:hypothetical protein
MQFEAFLHILQVQVDLLCIDEICDDSHDFM